MSGRPTRKHPFQGERPLATVEVRSWDPERGGFSAWDAHAVSELKRRLNRALSGPPQRKREVLRAIKNQEPVVMEGVDGRYLEQLRHILETLGGQVHVTALQA